MSGPNHCDETAEVRHRYARRAEASTDPRYGFLNPANWPAILERQAAIARLLQRHAPAPLATLQLLDVGCGEGSSLLEFVRMGFAPERLQGIELLPARVTAARHRLPAAIELHEGNALSAQIDDESQDIVHQSVVFSSLLDPEFQAALADRMWRWLRPGGAVLWYDFMYDNPSNRDVKGVPGGRVRALFPAGAVTLRRITLAPPIARRVCRLHPALYASFNALPLLRTHLLCWIQKP
jgi:SAM-dependent methyltransferase